jgi:hypothetical protein
LATSASQSPRLPMWHGITATSLPSFRSGAATSSQASALRLEITTFAPARAIASAIARPIPFDDPVTIATFPVKSNMVESGIRSPD